MQVSSGVVVTKKRTYFVSEMFDEGMTTITVSSEGLGKYLSCSDGVIQVGENTVVYSDDTIIDTYAVGTKHTYIEMIEEHW
jgi:hypothetical protein